METGSPNYWQCSTAIHYVTPQNNTFLIFIRRIQSYLSYAA